MYVYEYIEKSSHFAAKVWVKSSFPSLVWKKFACLTISQASLPNLASARVAEKGTNTSNQFPKPCRKSSQNRLVAVSASALMSNNHVWVCCLGVQLILAPWFKDKHGL